MKTIEEEANDYSKGRNASPIYKEAFIDGIKIAQRWIPMQEELPLILIEIILKCEKGRTEKTVFKPFTNGDIHWCSERFTHWRPVDRT